MKIGVVAIDGELRQVMAAEIGACGHEAAFCADITKALTAGVQLIFAEWGGGERLPELLAGLRAAADRAVAVPVVALVPIGAVALVHRARAAGAADVLYFPPDPAEIRAEIEDLGILTGDDVLAHPERFRELRLRILIGEDRAFLKCLEELRLAIRSEANILLIGATGTGKELFARAIHDLGTRSKESYLPVNCAGFPGGLLEGELFGHAKGAFTGADKERAGRFEEVGAGTLLLDEIGDIELPFQTKLLRAIEQRIFQRLGENKDRKFHARLISATSVDLDKAVVAGKFRPDLLARADQFRIVIPPLRERRSDISILSRHFIRKHAQGRLVELSRTVMEMLESYDFPMNVRQLENVIIGALMRSDPGAMVLPKHLPGEIKPAKSGGNVPSDHTISVPIALPYKDAREHALRMVDHIYLTELLVKHDKNYTKVAEEAGIDRKTLRERLRSSVGEQMDVAED